MILGDLKGIKRFILGFVSQAILEFAHTRKDTGAVSFQSPVLLAHAELNGEPVDSCESRQLSFTCTKGSKTDFLREVREILVCKHWSMA
jgi:hypothetical protein